MKWVYVEVPENGEPRVRTHNLASGFIENGFGVWDDHEVLLDTPGLKVCWWPEFRVLDIFVREEEP